MENTDDLKIEMFPIDKLIPYARNSRTHSPEQVKQIAGSIEEFGFVNPVLIDEKNIIICGHGRILGAEMVGVGQVPVIRLKHLSEARKKAYRIADNKLALNAKWEPEMLMLDLQELQDEMDFDIDVIGFDRGELSDIFKEEGEEDGFDVDAPLPEVPISKKGDLWLLGEHRLMCGDSTIEDDVMKMMGNAKADKIITDPPWNVSYGLKKHPNWKQRDMIKNDSMTTEEFAAFLAKSFELMAKVTKAGALIYVFMSAQEWGSLMPVMEKSGFHWSSTIIWNKDHHVMSRKDYHTKYEPIWYGWVQGSGRLHPLLDRKQSDVWDFDRPVTSELHPTMKPIPLLARAINNSSTHDEVVIDMFGGSGSSLITCEQTKRACYMMELDEKYCDVIVKRWEEYTGKKAELSG